MNIATADAPQPPEPPQDNECCGNGCDDCVWIRYRQAEQQYRLALGEWQLQHEAD